MIELQRLAASGLIPAAAQSRPYLFLLIGFGILVSLFPFHSWAPPAYASAPAPAAMLHAGVLKKFGLYGLIRLALPLLPEGRDRHWAIPAARPARRQHPLHRPRHHRAEASSTCMLGYSSVMHMGYIFLGIAALNIVGVSGAALLMFAHGLSIAALFAMAGMLREKQPHALASTASAGWPSRCRGSASPSASRRSPPSACPASRISPAKSRSSSAPSRPAAGHPLRNFQLATIFALWGVVISAVYMLRAYRAIFMGEPGKDVAGWTDPVQVAALARHPAARRAAPRRLRAAASSSPTCSRASKRSSAECMIPSALPRNHRPAARHLHAARRVVQQERRQDAASRRRRSSSSTALVGFSFFTTGNPAHASTPLLALLHRRRHRALLQAHRAADHHRRPRHVAGIQERRSRSSSPA